MTSDVVRIGSFVILGDQVPGQDFVSRVPMSNSYVLIIIDNIGLQLFGGPGGPDTRKEITRSIFL